MLYVSISCRYFFLKEGNFFFFQFILDWESQLKPKESTPLQDILEENSSHDLQMVRFTGDDSLLPLIEEVEEYVSWTRTPGPGRYLSQGFSSRT